jgi:regulator of replication initiation timing
MKDKRKTRTIIMCKKDIRITSLEANNEHLEAENQRLKLENNHLLSQLKSHMEIQERANARFQERLDQAMKELEELDD